MMDLPFKVSQREKMFFVIGAVLAALILIYWITAWHGDVTTDMSDMIDAKQIMLQKQMDNISDMSLLQERLDRVRQSASAGKKSLLNGDKPPVAAAELQSVLKDILSSLQIEMRSERTLASVDAGYYLGIPVEIGFVSDTGKLKGFLYRLRISALLLNVTGLKARVTNINRPEDTYVTLVITGFIKKPSDEVTDKKEQ